MSKSKSREASYVVDTFLPQEYLLDLGRYVQTCAHIEFLVCLAICKIEGVTSPETSERCNELRILPTKSLITELSKASSKCTDTGWASYFKDLSGWFHREINTRHMAIHGAHFSCSGVIRVNAGQKGTNKGPQIISRAEVKETLEIVDQLLENLHRFIKEARDENRDPVR